jgi:hypothetical protein
MALAILESLGSVQNGAGFRIDTGTNRYYQLKVGRGKERRAGLEWVDQVIFSTPVATNRSSGELLGSATEVVLPARYFDRGHAYVQLLTFKTTDGISPAVSRVVLVPAGIPDVPHDIDIDGAESLSRPTSMNTTLAFRPARSVSCRTGPQVYARQASIGDLLGQIAKIAAPIVANLLSNAPAGAAANGAGSGTAAGGAGSGTGATPFDIIGRVLQSVIGALQLPAATGAAPLSIATSSRFRNGGLSRPFIFGIDDALIASLAGPVLQVLPQLMNAVNQNRLQMKQSQNQLITNLVSSVNQRLMVDKLLEAQRQAAAAQPGGGASLSDLIQLLQQVPDAGTATPAPPPAPVATAVTHSLSVSVPQGPGDQVSARAVLAFLTAAPVTWNGTPTVVFSKAQPVQFKVQLKVNGAAPTRPLPKAIVRIVFKDGSTQSVWLEKSFRQIDVAAESVLSLSFTHDELARLPTNTPIAVLGELRWPGRAGGQARSALGSVDVVVADKFFLKAQGEATSPEVELTDMRRFRPFWNKVWEAPILDAAQASRDGGKHLWALNVTARYSVLLAPDADANGVMETKVLRGPADPESLTEAVDGRLKAGVELSVAELNKLLPLWENRPPLDRERLQALSTRPFAERNAGEFVHPVKLKGKAGQRGTIWVTPVFRLFGLTLGSVQKIDETGQVTEVAEETVAFPLPVAARIIGLKSQ